MRRCSRPFFYLPLGCPLLSHFLFNSYMHSGPGSRSRSVNRYLFKSYTCPMITFYLHIRGIPEERKLNSTPELNKTFRTSWKSLHSTCKLPLRRLLESDFSVWMCYILCNVLLWCGIKYYFAWVLYLNI